MQYATVCVRGNHNLKQFYGACYNVIVNQSTDALCRLCMQALARRAGLLIPPSSTCKRGPLINIASSDSRETLYRRILSTRTANEVAVI